MKGLEDQLIMRLVDALTPTIHKAVQNAIKTMRVPLSGVVLNNNSMATHHGDIEDLYANEEIKHGESSK